MIAKGGCSVGLGEGRKTCTPTKGIVFGVSECVREKECGELIECTNKVMRDGLKVEPRKITCGRVCVCTDMKTKLVDISDFGKRVCERSGEDR